MIRIKNVKTFFYIYELKQRYFVRVVATSSVQSRISSSQTDQVNGCKVGDSFNFSPKIQRQFYNHVFTEINSISQEIREAATKQKIVTGYIKLTTLMRKRRYIKRN